MLTDNIRSSTSLTFCDGEEVCCGLVLDQINTDLEVLNPIEGEVGTGESKHGEWEKILILRVENIIYLML